MEGIFWLLLLSGLAAGALLALALSRRMLSQELPEQTALLVVLHQPDRALPQLEALAAQMTWMDSTLLRQVWLVDGTADGALEPICSGFCRTHPAFHYCTSEQCAEFFGNMGKLEKKDCILSMNHV